MARCANCDAELRAEWKFCIFCGTPVDPQQPRPPAIPAIPAAIRPEADPAPRRAVDVPLIAGILLGVGGLVLVVYLVVVFGGTA